MVKPFVIMQNIIRWMHCLSKRLVVEASFILLSKYLNVLSLGLLCYIIHATKPTEVWSCGEGLGGETINKLQQT